MLPKTKSSILTFCFRCKNPTKEGAAIFYKRTRALLPAMALLLLLAITVTKGMLSNTDALDIMFGKGPQTVISLYDSQDASYYALQYATQKEVKAQAQNVSKQISDEGIVLLKNDGLLPITATTPVTPFGLGFVKPYYCGGGSSAISTAKGAVITPLEGLKTGFQTINTAFVQQQDILTLASAAPNESFLYEYDAASYETQGVGLQNTIGLVYLKRQTGENQDAYLHPYEDGTPHMLAITANEQALIDYAAAHCAGVVVILCSSSPMEIPQLKQNDKVNAILWVGGAGSTGYASLADILVGKATPSGHLPSTFCANFTLDPTYLNQDDGSDRFTYSNAFSTFITSTAIQENVNTAFHEYEEGIYIGYKYYETAYAIGALEDYYSPQGGVVYPFGHGLSYTHFTQEIVDYDIGAETITLTVKVTNAGGQYAGKDVVQLYMSAPYTAFDSQYLIEKPSVSLMQFAKTGLLAPGEAEEITLSIPIEDMASYCYMRDNSDGTNGCYVLEKGAYTLSIRSNSHDLIDSRTYQRSDTLWFDGDHKRLSDAPNYFANNKFSLLNTYMTSPQISGATILTRSDWLNTQPTAPTQKDREASQTIVNEILKSDSTVFSYQTDTPLGNQAGSDIYTPDSPATGANNGLILADLRGRDYADPMWTLLLDQLTFQNSNEIRQCLFEAGYKTGALKEIGKPASVEHDGPQGLTLADISGKNWLTDMCEYPATPVAAATWNRPLLYAMGSMVGQEALAAKISGWYAPGLNILRSPFCGRASEYYSEDPLLSGYLGAQVVSGAGDMGLYCAVKHFAIMDTEAHRSPNTCAWMTEQALRETYLKPFEIVIKTAQKNINYFKDNQPGTFASKIMPAGDFLMASDSALGTDWSATNAALLTDVVRNEWGFQGAIISDMHMDVNANMVDNLVRAGCDVLMSNSNNRSTNAQDYLSATGQSVLRRAIKNLCYVLVNSNAMQGIPPASIVEYGLSNWMLCLIAINGLVLLMLLIGAFLCIQEHIKLKRRTK